MRLLCCNYATSSLSFFFAISLAAIARRCIGDWSIKRSLETYDVLLKQIDVSIELHSVDSEQRKKIASKFQVVVKVTGMLDEGLGTFTPYKKEISFLMEPTVKRYKI